MEPVFVTILTAVAIARRQTPLEQLDPNDILDAEGIRKIRSRAS